jgi:hypothetical protein
MLYRHPISMLDITLTTAVFDLHGDCVLALNWYKHLSFQQRQDYIDSIGIYRARYIHQFTLDALWYIQEHGENGFDIEALTDLSNRIRRKVHGNDSTDQSIR